MRYRRTLLWLFVCSLAVTALLGVTALLLPDEVPKEAEILASAILLTIYSLVGLVCAAALTRRRFLPLAWTGAALLAVSFVSWLVFLWTGEYLKWQTVENFAKANGTATILGVLAMHAVLLLLVRVSQSVAKWVRRATICAAIIVGIWTIGMMWSDFDISSDFLDRLIGSVAIVGSLGTIAMPLLGRLEKFDQQARNDTGLSGFVPVAITCPRCAHVLTIAGNKMRRCEGCGLKIKVHFEEPRCVCGYLLLGLTGDTCPECGKTIAQDDRWRGTEQAPEHPEDQSEHSEDT